MKILIDNCVPRPFERLLTGHEPVHCSRLGWERLVNGRPLTAAEDAGYSVLVTVDQGFEHQQNMTGRKIVVMYLRTVKNDLPTLKPMAQMVLATLADLEPGSFVTLEHPSRQRR